MRDNIRHIYIPDTQVKEGVDTSHIEAIGNYIVDKRPNRVIIAGDWWDMPSLSHYDVGTIFQEGVTYQGDIEAGQAAAERLMRPIWNYNNLRRTHKKKSYKPEIIFLCGNHEQRIERAIENDRKWEGKIGYSDLGVEKFGWDFNPFLHIVEREGVYYSHYFVNPDSLYKRAIGGTMQNKLKLLSHSFTMGHQQTYQVGVKYTAGGRAIRGLVCGSFYTHDERYLGPQGNDHWRGAFMKTEVKDGNYCLVELSIPYLLNNWI